MKKFDVFMIGTATRDIFITSPLFKIVHDPKHLRKLGFPTGEAQCFALGGKVEVGKPVLTIGGGAVNAGVTFSRQGYKTATLFKIGKDQNGSAVLEDLKKEKITPFPIFDKKKGTAYSVILLSSTGERTILNYRGASEDLKKSDIPFSKLNARWAYIAPGRIAFPLMLAMIHALRKRGARIAMDPSKYYLKMGVQKLKPLLQHLDVIKMNREEASYLTGISYRDERRIFKKFDDLVKGIAVMTGGSKGVIVSDGKRIYKAGIYKEKVTADRTGAGDAFGSGFVAGLMKYQVESRKYKGEKIAFSREAIEHAIRLGSANATSVVEHIGAQGGILTRRAFISQSRFKKLNIKEKKLV